MGLPYAASGTTWTGTGRWAGWPPRHGQATTIGNNDPGKARLTSWPGASRRPLAGQLREDNPGSL